MNDATINMTLPKKLKKQAQRKALQMDMTLSQYIRKLINETQQLEEQRKVNWKCMETARHQAQKLADLTVEKWELLDELGRIDEEGREIKKK